ncbi:hypothetical protein [Hydrogenophaga atypica]|uniref:Uncharacterized protein n=1 Tax=Hydrogenophaga atypica TaxID=249409 RepID=A0ABW2QQB8_9BURK
MPRLDKRVRKLEESAAHVDLEALTDDELMQFAGKHWKVPPWGSRQSVAAVLTKVLRKPSPFLPVQRDLDFHGDPKEAS